MQSLTFGQFLYCSEDHMLDCIVLHSYMSKFSLPTTAHLVKDLKILWQRLPCSRWNGCINTEFSLAICKKFMLLFFIAQHFISIVRVRTVYLLFCLDSTAVATTILRSQPSLATCGLTLNMREPLQHQVTLLFLPLLWVKPINYRPNSPLASFDIQTIRENEKPFSFSYLDPDIYSYMGVTMSKQGEQLVHT